MSFQTVKNELGPMCYFIVVRVLALASRATVKSVSGTRVSPNCTCLYGKWEWSRVSIFYRRIVTTLPQKGHSQLLIAQDH